MTFCLVRVRLRAAPGLKPRQNWEKHMVVYAHTSTVSSNGFVFYSNPSRPTLPSTTHVSDVEGHVGTLSPTVALPSKYKVR